MSDVAAKESGYLLWLHVSVWGSLLLFIFVKANLSLMEGEDVNPKQQLQTHINTLRGHSYDSVYISTHIRTYMVTVRGWVGTDGTVLAERSGLQIERGL